MSEIKLTTGVVSWQTFDEMFESQLDFLCKLRFLARVGMIENNGLALEIIADLLNLRESQIRQLREEGLAEKEQAAERGVLTVARTAGPPQQAATLDIEEQRLLEKISAIHKLGGYQWDSLQTMIEGAYHLCRGQRQQNSA